MRLFHSFILSITLSYLAGARIYNSRLICRPIKKKVVFSCMWNMINTINERHNLSFLLDYRSLSNIKTELGKIDASILNFLSEQFHRKSEVGQRLQRLKGEKLTSQSLPKNWLSLGSNFTFSQDKKWSGTDMRIWKDWIFKHWLVE